MEWCGAHVILYGDMDDAASRRGPWSATTLISPQPAPSPQHPRCLGSSLDLVEAYKLVVETEGLGGEVINFGSGKETSIRYLAEGLCERIDPDIAPEFAEGRAGEVSSFIAGIEKAKGLGWSPKVGIDEGLDLYLEWLRKDR